MKKFLITALMAASLTACCQVEDQPTEAEVITSEPAQSGEAVEIIEVPAEE